MQAPTYLLAATVLFTALNVCVKFLPEIPTVQIVLFRGMVTFFICAAILRSSGISVWGHRKRILILRGIFGTLSLLALFYSLQNMPIAMAMTLSNLAPLFTVFLARILLKEKAHWLQGVFLVGAFSGVIIVKGWDPSVSWGLALYGISGALMAACAYTCVRILRTTEHPLVVMFYFPLVSFPLTLPPTVMQWVSPTWTQWGLLLIIGVLTQGAQYCMTRAYQLEKAAKIMVYNYAAVIWALFAGWLIFDEKFEWPQLWGLGLILVCLLGSARLAAWQNRKVGA